MKDSIIDSLANLFSQKFRAKLKRAETLNALIAQLRKKEKRLKKKLAMELTESEAKLYKSQLKVLKAQRKKAESMVE